MKIFITGVSSGLGLAMAKYYLEAGHTVGGCSFEPAQKLSAVLPLGCVYYEADVRDEKKMHEAISLFAQKYQRLDLVICNAGISMQKKSFPDFEVGKKLVEVNILGVLNTLAPALEIMKHQKSGHIVGIASLSSLVGLPGMALYGSTKAFILNLFESLSVDLKSYGILTTCLVPGFIDTPLTKKNTHKMPGLLSVEKALKIMIRAIEEEKELVIFPWPMSLVMKILRMLPRPLYRFIMRRDLLGFRGSEK